MFNIEIVNKIDTNWNTLSKKESHLIISLLIDLGFLLGTLPVYYVYEIVISDNLSYTLSLFKLLLTF